MLNCRKWLVKVVQQLFPLIIPWRLAKPDSMVFQILPFDQQQILVWDFQTTLQLMRNVTWH